MTQEEVRQVLVFLKEYYPQSFVHHSAEGSRMVLSVWSETFQDEDPKLVWSAVKDLVQTNTTNFAPNIGQIREKMLELTGVHIMSAEEVWNIARKFWCNLGTRSASEIEPRYKELPEEVRRAFSISDMIQHADMNTADVLQFEKPRFLKEYRNIESQHKEKMLAGTISQNAIAYGEHLMIGEKK